MRKQNQKAESGFLVLPIFQLSERRGGTTFCRRVSYKKTGNGGLEISFKAAAWCSFSFGVHQ